MDLLSIDSLSDETIADILDRGELYFSGNRGRRASERLHGRIVFNVFYQFAMAPIVEQGLFGNGSPGFFNTDILSKSAIFKIGTVSVNNFDPAANWYSGTNDPGVKVVAGGLFTDTGSSSAGFIPPNVDIVAFPTPASPWLEVEIH